MFAFVAQRVVFGGDDEGGRQAGQVRGAQRRGIGMDALGRVTEIMGPEPSHRIAGQPVALGVLRVGRRAGRVIVGHRIEQQLDA
jgi:hypothetical protein